MKTRFQYLALLSAAVLGTAAQAQESRGVNPADIDSRFDLIVKRVNLDPDGTTDIVTVKYDYKLSNTWGLNFELPAYSKLNTPGYSTSGNGDLFARARWIVPYAGWSVGVSAETVLPVASRDPLGTGKYQLNLGALAVKPWSASFLTAFVAKQTTSVAGESDRASFSNTEVRFVPVFILPHGWAISGEVRQTWEHRSDMSWQRVEATLNKQFSQQWAGTFGYSHDFGDRKDRGTWSTSAKYFF